MRILGTTVLNILQTGIEFEADFADLRTVGIGLLRIDIVDFVDRGDHRSRTAAAALFERRQLLDGNATLLDFETHILGQLTKALVGDRRQHRLRLRRDVLAVLDAEEVAGAALLDVLMLGRIEIHHARITHLMCLFARHDAGRIVAADFHVARTARCRTVLFTVDDDLHRFDAALEISAHRRTVNDQQRILRRFHTQTGRRTEHHGSQIERGARPVGRNETLVALHYLDARIDNHLDRRNRQTQTLGRRTQTLRVLLDTEQSHLAVDAAERLETLEEFDAIVQTRSRHVHLDVLVARDLHVAPLAVDEFVADIKIGLHIIEA